MATGARKPIRDPQPFQRHSDEDAGMRLLAF
jgi:hypothetical protein